MSVVDIKKENIILYFKTVYEAEIKYLKGRAQEFEQLLSTVNEKRMLVDSRLKGISEKIGRATESDIESYLYLIGDDPGTFNKPIGRTNG